MMKPIAFLLLLAVALSGCSAQTKAEPQERQDRQEPVSTTAPSNHDQEAVSQIWCMELLGKTALEVAEAQDSPLEGWERTVNMWGYDYWLDAKNGMIYYLFANDNQTLGGEETCYGVLLELKNCFSFHSDAPQEMIQELSDILDSEFEWVADEEEESYCYLSHFESGGQRYQINVYTDAEKQFSSDAGVRLVWVAEDL